MQSELELIDYFGEFISDSKKETIERVLGYRTRYITVVLENIFQPHNASAVIRSCDCYGIQDLHIIENDNEYVLNPNVTQGSSKWVDIYRYNDAANTNTLACIDHLKSEGYEIYATSSHDSGFEVTELVPDHKMALLFGTELTGLSQQALSHARKMIKIPMFGFTESFNLSVSVALCLQTLIDKLHQANIYWKLTDKERQQLRLSWYRKSVRNSDILENAFYENRGGKK
jgi:tRNA (guanosine-2'-O-)-methyltransferase